MIPLEKIRAAQRVLAKYLPRTPLVASPALDALLEARAYLKLESCSPVGSFKGRGAIYAIREWLREMPTSGERPHVVTASSGNHGFAVAYAARRLGARATVFVHETASAAKVANIRGQQAELILQGRDFDEAKEFGRKFAEECGGWWLEDGENADVSVGTATIGAEIVDDLPEVEEIFVPVGNGALIGGIGSAVRALKRSAKVTGIQPAQAPAMALSFAARRPVSTESSETIADGLASRIAIPAAVELMCAVTDRMVQVSEESIASAVRILVEQAHVLVEPAAAAALAGALERSEKLRGKSVVLVITGANITREALLRAIGVGPVQTDSSAARDGHD